MDGREPIAVRILTIVLMRLVSMALPVSMVLVVFIVVVSQAKRVYCVIWTMHAHQILAMLMPFVIPAQSMDHIHAHAHRATKESIVPKILTNASKDHRANTTVFALIRPGHLPVTALKDSPDHDAKPMLTNVKVIRAKMMAVVSTIRALSDAFACQVSK